MGEVFVRATLEGAGDILLLSADAAGTITLIPTTAKQLFRSHVRVRGNIEGPGKFISINVRRDGTYTLDKDVLGPGSPVRVVGLVADYHDSIWVSDDSGALDFSLGFAGGRGGASIPAWVDANAVYDYDFFNNRYWPAPIASELTDVRASSKFGQSVAGVLTSFGNNVLAITDTLSVEPAASNSIGQTQTFDNASWTKNQVNTVTADAAVAPDGTMTADLVVANGTSNAHYISAFAVANATPYEASVYVKAGTALFFHFLITSTSTYVQFDLTTGAVTFSGAGTGVLTSITPAVLLANGWWDLRFRFTQSSGSTQTLRMFPLAASQNIAQPIETSTASVYLWGAQLKTTGMGTSYIPAVASTPTTRAANAITGVRTGASSVKYTFDNDATQTVAGLNPNTYTLSIPTNLTRPLQKRLTGLKASLYLGAVATRGLVGDNFNNTKFQIMSHTHHDFRDTVTNAQLLLIGWCAQGVSNAETNAGAATSVTASYSLTGNPSGAWTPILFSGVATGSIPDGGELLSDAFGSFSAGTRIWIRHWKNCAGGIIGNADTVRDDVAGEFSAYGVTTPDLTAGGVITNSGTACAFPAGIVAQTRKVTVGIIGDSRGYGYGDTYDAAGEIGEVCRTIGPAFAYINTCRRSMNPGQFVASHTKRVALLKTYCSHIYSELGGAAYTNGASTTGQFQTDMTAIWGYFSPLKVFQSTMSITSTGAWTLADLSDQTATNQPNFQISNDWIRTTPAPLTGYFEVADVGESSRNSGKWKADGTPLKWVIDGIHGSQYYCLQIPISGAITLSSFWR